ncbi:transcriptional regulator [Paenibacillus yonginensis]|uniref:Transcriptional regulator n=1 Tax=Paenibacillus yonginensis TaxID=1462996 RepID=A0A1B1MWM8_9BACL|nr:WYL domain-containing protein [Paenibacillus yonginensis]ANS73591.1 transcriptional regulator [Paenibacillus yonginensis]
MNERRLAIMRLLDSRTKITARELAERFGVSVRTIQRDLDHLQQSGFPLYTETGPHGGYRVLPNRILPPLQLNLTEALGLFLMLRLLEQIKDFPYSAVREHLALQYFAELPRDVQERIDRLQDHLVFPALRNTPSSPFTTDILNAALERREIRFLYASPAGRPEAKQAYPLGIYYDNQRWYMPALANERVLLYRVDRVLELEVLEPFPVPDGNAGAAAKLPTLKAWISAVDERPGVRVVLRFTEFGARLAADEPLFQPIHDGEWVGSVPPSEFRYLSRKLLGYGPDVRVLEPQELRERMRKLLEENLASYLE